MARQQPKQERDRSTVVRDVIRRARDSTPANSAKPVKLAVDPGERGSTHVLPNGTRLAEFEIVDLIGEGGFGIVYLAYDHSLARHVAIKEYMPSGMASRTHTLQVSVRSNDLAAVFKAGLRSFINEARLLAQFDSPALVKVFRFWEGNNTAYMVMPFYEGITLKKAYKEHKIVPTEEWIRMFLFNLCGALEMIHRARCYHRDIAPDNILVLPEGQPLLLDFGAARQVINERTQGPTAILKPGFAPIEQYANIADLKQGPWTDVYALAAVVYYLITGKAPLPAVARYVRDEMQSAREAGRKRYSAGFLAAIDRALAVRPDQRFQSIAELRSAMGIDGDVARTILSADVPELTELTQRAEATVRADPVPDSTQSLAATHVLTSAAPVAAPASDDSRTRRIEPRIEPRLDPVDPVDPIDPPHPPPPFAATPGRPNLRRRGPISPARLKWGAAALALLVIVGGAVTYRTMSGAPGGQAGAPDVAAANNREEEFRPIRPIRPPGNPAPQVPLEPAATDATGAARTPSTAASTPLSPPTSTPVAPAKPVPPPMPESLIVPSTREVASTAAPPASDATLWKEAVTVRTANAYQRYLDQYPSGRHARQATERLAMLRPDRAAESRGSAASNSASPATVGESSLWSQANATNTAAAYQDYLNTFPAGQYARTARNRLEVLKQKQPPEAEPTTVLPSVGTAAPKGPSTEVPARQAAAPDKPAIQTVRPTGPTVQAGAAPAIGQSEPPAAPSKPPSNAPPTREADGSGPRQGSTIRVAGQTFMGNFMVDPASGIISGSGRVTWNNGDRFDGTMVNGVKQGQGEFVWANGQRYQGSWARDLPNGSGALHFANGNDYAGQVRDGVPNGKGSLKYADGSHYQGGFSNGLPDGMGVSAFKNGDAYDGHWSRGKSNGHGKYTWANGDAWEGEFRNDQRTTDGKMVFAGSSAEAAAPDNGGESTPRATGLEK